MTGRMWRQYAQALSDCEIRLATLSGDDHVTAESRRYVEACYAAWLGTVRQAVERALRSLSPKNRPGEGG